MASKPEIRPAKSRSARKHRAGIIPVVIIVGLAIFLLARKKQADAETDTTNELLRITWRATSGGVRPTTNPEQAEGSSPVSSGLEESNDPAVRQQIALANPGASGWESEALSESASQVLSKLSSALVAFPVELRTEDPAALITPDFSLEGFGPPETKPLFKDDSFTVWRTEGPIGESPKPAAPVGLAAFQILAARLNGTIAPGVAPHLKFKIVGVTLEEESFETRVAVEWTQGNRQLNAEWRCTWARPAEESDPPRLMKVVQTNREEIQRTMSVPALEDCTATAMRGAPSYRAQFLRSNSHWAQRQSVLEGTSLLGHHGLAVGDANGDRLDDLYVCDGGGLPNRLYLQNPDGSLRDVSRQAGVDWLEYTAAALFVDLDNDGDQDLVLATVAMLLFMSNDGRGEFTLEGGHHGVVQARSLCAGDYDNDGDLDIFVASYANPNKATGFGTRGVSSSIPIPYHDANNGSRNALLKNNGKFRFVDAISECGLNHDNSRFSFAASWEDYDLDGDLDLYVANDFGRNCLYRNDGGNFRNVAGELGVEDMASGMSASWGDCNGDGRPDLYVGNMFSSAGQRITYQRRFGDRRSEAALSGLQRMARGNSLFLNNGPQGAFDDVSEAARVTMGRWAWSSQFTDLNNDGRLDLVVANGFLTNRRTDDL